jgi:hypothetical protein
VLCVANLHANASSAGVGAHVPYDNWPWLQLVMFVAAARAKSATTPSAVALNVYRMRVMIEMSTAGAIS